MSTLTKLESLLTPQQINNFVKKAVPELKSQYLSLQQNLEKRQWKRAARQAHTLKSTIGLFSSPELVASLDLIESENVDLIQLPSFQKSMQQQQQQLLISLEASLAKS